MKTLKSLLPPVTHPNADSQTCQRFRAIRYPVAGFHGEPQGDLGLAFAASRKTYG